MRPTVFARTMKNRAASHVFRIALVLCVAVLEPLVAASYDELHSAAVARCAAIDPSAYQSGLAFNPDGYRSYYLRSECLQKTAVDFRDESLCQQVKQRRSLFSSSWGYSPDNCRELVRHGVAEDVKALQGLKEGYVRGPIALRDFRVERNGNGRDFDIIPAFTGAYAHGYTVTFEILREGGASPVVFYSSGHYLDAQSNLRLYVPQSDLRQRFPTLVLNRQYTVRGTVTLDVGNGGPSGYWSNAFIDRLFPAGARAVTLTRSVLL